ncbi:hypothetical protein OJAV_G00051780 [Oryzias javanicus]|uniref:Uncharacterized protein n=1 Tax=Oryzias javanicus TaxID=123683 RepID=A0A3S2PNF8_ORYJA|nr:hypothetical protein OJAV_G00051780 [Oryzias javanicus]
MTAGADFWQRQERDCSRMVPVLPGTRLCSSGSRITACGVSLFSAPAFPPEKTGAALRSGRGQPPSPPQLGST